MWLTKLEQLADPKYGLEVVFEPGWKRRGASGGAQMKTVAGVLWHHDVAPRTGIYPLRAMLRDGRKGLSGPLCHIGFDRNGVVHVVGAGKANHAGTGSVPGVVRNGGNTRLIGIEMTSAGTRPWDWTDAQLRQMPLLGAALNDIFGLTASKHWAHYEYSNGGKIDPAGLPGAMPGLRSRIAAVRFGGVPGPGTSAPRPSSPADPAKPWTTSPRVNAMSAAEVRAIQTELVGAGYSVGSYGVDGSYGDGTGTAVQQLQTDLGLTADGVWGPATQEALMTLKTQIDQIHNLVVERGYLDTKISHVEKRILDGIPNRVWGIGGGKDAPMISRRFEKGKEYPETTLGSLTDRIVRQQLVPLRGEVAGLSKAIEQLAAGRGVDPEEIKAAVAAGVDEALGSLEVTVSKGD